MDINEAIGYYTCDGADYINSYLRDEKFSDETEEYVNQCIDIMDKSFYPCSEDFTVYRGIFDLITPQEGLQKGYTSTTENINIAKEFSGIPYGCKGCILSIEVEKGTKIYKPNKSFQNEKEIIIQRNCNLVIKEFKDGIYYCKISP